LILNKVTDNIKVKYFKSKNQVLEEGYKNIPGEALPVPYGEKQEFTELPV